MSPGAKVVAVVIGLVIVTVGVLAMDAARASNSHRPCAEQFQRMAGGLGLGATVCPRWCFVNFDPRIERCTCGEYPLPGGYCYCPEHAGTISFFPFSSPVTTATQNWQYRTHERLP
jgi:hypothetical protein